MRIKIIPGEYNSELVEKVKNVMKQSDCDEKLYDLAESYGNDAVIDAIYYASEARDEKLADQEAYFQQQLMDDEFSYYIERFLAS